MLSALNYSISAYAHLSHTSALSATAWPALFYTIVYTIVYSQRYFIVKLLVEPKISFPCIFIRIVFIELNSIVFRFITKLLTIPIKAINGKWQMAFKGLGSALLCLRPLVLITGKHNWGDGFNLCSVQLQSNSPAINIQYLAPGSVLMIFKHIQGKENVYLWADLMDEVVFEKRMHLKICY